MNTRQARRPARTDRVWLCAKSLHHAPVLTTIASAPLPPQALLTSSSFFQPCPRCTAPGACPPSVPARELLINYFDMDDCRGAGCCNVCKPAYAAVHRSVVVVVVVRRAEG